jgi:hypothetical protein
MEQVSFNFESRPVMANYLHGKDWKDAWARSEAEQAINEDLIQIYGVVSNFELYKMFQTMARDLCGGIFKTQQR